MKRILVDMDGVLVDIYTRFLELHEKETGQRLTIDDVAGLLEVHSASQHAPEKHPPCKGQFMG